MATLNHAPHLRAVSAGLNNYDPVHNSIFEVELKFPVLCDVTETALLQQQITNVGGIDALHKTPAAGSQKFYGVDVSYLNPVHDNTYADITIDFNLNLRKVTDNYVLNAFMKWRNLNYNLGNGARYLKTDYIAPDMTIKIANRDGTIWRVVTFYQVMLTGVSGFDGLDITSNEPVKLSCTFRSDFWDDTANAGENSPSSNPVYFDGTEQAKSGNGAAPTVGTYSNPSVSK